MQYILALSWILISPDIWIHFRIRIEILDDFGFALKTGGRLHQRYWNHHWAELS